MSTIIVTSYCGPDLDGVAASYAYAEFLQKTGKDANYYLEGTPKKEVSIVCDLFHISLSSCEKDDSNSIVIVDTNTIRDIPKFINIEHIVEIIDHHILSEDINKLSKAKVQIEMLGAVATLIAEKFYQNDIEISRNSAVLLYYAIISNSINLHSRNTSEKDKKMANWLKEQCKEIKEEYIKVIFEEKSKINEKDLRKEMEAEYMLEIASKKIIIAQLEIVDAMSFLKDNKNEIEKILADISKENQLDYIFLNCIDILNGYCIIYTPFSVTEKYLNNFFEGNFEDGQLIVEPLFMRKEIIKLLKENAESLI